MAIQKSFRRRADDVALTITNQLFSNQEKNIVFSPLSLHAVLSVMAAGSDGRTLDELLSFLRFDSVDNLTAFVSHLFSAVFSSEDHLSFANGLWAHESVSFSHSFKQLVATHYKATVASLDFMSDKGDQVCHEVNSWVKKETNGLITDLLSPKSITSNTSLIFANALHFKAVWKHKFDALGTFDYDFHSLNGTRVPVPFMTSTKKTQYIRAFDGFKVLRLFYKQGRDKKCRFSMCIFLPNEKDGLPALIGKLASESAFLKGKLPRRKVRVPNFRIPKFKISFTLEASNVLKELGVLSPWKAGFTKMADSDTLYFERTFHKASIEVNEEGTEVTAANLVQLKTLCATARTGRDFIADHPFLFLIQEDFTGTILFMGQVLNPLDGAAMSAKEFSVREHLKMLRRRTNLVSDFEPAENREEEDEGDHDDDDMFEARLGHLNAKRPEKKSRIREEWGEKDAKRNRP